MKNFRTYLNTQYYLILFKHTLFSHFSVEIFSLVQNGYPDTDTRKVYPWTALVFLVKQTLYKLYLTMPKRNRHKHTNKPTANINCIRSRVCVRNCQIETCAEHPQRFRAESPEGGGRTFPRHHSGVGRAWHWRYTFGP